MLRTARMFAATLLLAGALAFVTATTAAGDCAGWDCDGDATPEAEGGTIAITVTQTSILPGGTVGDSSTGTGSTTVYIPPPCMYEPFMTGAEYYEYVESGRFYDHNGLDHEPAEPYPNYEDYEDDTEGYWWTASCHSGRYADYFGFDHREEFDEFVDDFFEYTNDFFDNEYDPQFIPGGEDPPVPDVEIPPEILMLVAQDEMDLPEPEVGWNPSRTSDAATFVNLDTWVWLNGSPIILEINAAAGTNEATVTATLESTTVSAPDATGDTCPGAGVAWAADADPGAACQVIFNRSSANQPGQVTPVTVETQWTVEWSANGAAQGPLEPQTLTAVNDVPVAEVQTIVTDG